MTLTEARFVRAVVGDKTRIKDIGPYRYAGLMYLYDQALKNGKLYRKFLVRRRS